MCASWYHLSDDYQHWQRTHWPVCHSECRPTVPASRDGNALMARTSTVLTDLLTLQSVVSSATQTQAADGTDTGWLGHPCTSSTPHVGTVSGVYSSGDQVLQAQESTPAINSTRGHCELSVVQYSPWDSSTGRRQTLPRLLLAVTVEHSRRQ